jgi:hypothetical protein
MDKDLEIMIEQAFARIDRYNSYRISHNGCYHKYSAPYVFTNENLKDSFKQLDLNNKSLLTVCGGGDQVLNAILLGTKRIDAFDISIFSEMVLNIKIAAIKSLSFKEFFEFFYLMTSFFDSDMNKYANAFNIKTYWKISPYLDDRTKIFWDNLFLEETGFEIRKSPLFDNDVDEKKVLPLMNNYLNTSSYYKLKRIIDNCDVNFILSDIKNLKNKLNNTYDIIYLSNIAQYINKYDDIKQKNDEECMKNLNDYKKLVMSFVKLLNKDGIISIAYLFDYLTKENIKYCEWPYIFREGKRSIVFPSNKYSYIEFPGVDDLQFKSVHGEGRNEKDAILIYKKII